MTEVTQATELAVRMHTDPGELARLVVTVGATRAETLANCSYQDRDSTVVLLITDDPVQSSAVLRAASYQVKTNAVVLVRALYKPELAARLGARLAEAGIGILYSYVSWSEGHRACLVFKTTDDEYAVNLLRTEMLVCDVARERSVAPRPEQEQAAA